MRVTRLLIGIIVIVAALWIIVGEQMSGASADAVVNARVTTLRSAVAGQLELEPHTLGSIVAEGEVVAAVSDSLTDNLRLNDLRMERDFVAADVAAAKAMLDAKSSTSSDLRTRAETYRKERLADLRTRLDHARARLDLLETQGAPDPDTAPVAEALNDAQDGQPFDPANHDLALDQARESVALLEIAVRAAEQHVFLGDGTNIGPNVRQRAAELQGEIAELQIELERRQAHLAALEQRLQREQVRVSALGGGTIVSPVNGIYWEVMQSNGATIQRGDPILRIVDCASTVVTLSVAESVYNSLSLGQSASFRLAGQRKSFDATVARLAGSGAETVYRNLAVAPSQKHLERYDVLLLVPGLTNDPNLGCAIGRTGRAFFDTRPLDWLRNLFG